MITKKEKKIAELAERVTKLQHLHPDLVEIAWDLWHLLPPKYLRR